MRRDPLLPFGAVVGDGADQEHDVADQGRPGGDVEQFGEAASVLVAAVALGHADAGVPDRGGHRPRAQAVVLDDRVPGLRRALRGAVVDLDAGHHPGQVRVLEGFGLPGGGLAAPRRPAERLADGEAEAGEQPAGGRSAADGDDDQHRHHGGDRGELGREQPALLVGGHEHGDDREGQGRQPGAGQPEEEADPVRAVVVVHRCHDVASRSEGQRDAGRCRERERDVCLGGVADDVDGLGLLEFGDAGGFRLLRAGATGLHHAPVLDQEWWLRVGYVDVRVGVGPVIHAGPPVGCGGHEAISPA